MGEYLRSHDSPLQQGKGLEREERLRSPQIGANMQKTGLKIARLVKFFIKKLIKFAIRREKIKNFRKTT